MNGVISSATLTALNLGWRVVGFVEGFKYIMKGETEHVMELTVEMVSRIHQRGGSIIKTSRANPTGSTQSLDNVKKVFADLGITHLITIGGDDTAFSSSTVAKHCDGIAVVHVPKTIDNDLPLPPHQPTFGFTTATEFGTEIVRALMEDTKTAPRWFIVEAMGRKAGHLALSMGKASGAHLTLIPEEWKHRSVKFEEVCDLIWLTMLKRLALGKNYGVVVMAEGLVEFMSEEELERVAGRADINRDPHGHIRLDDFEFGRFVRDEIRRRASQYDVPLNCTDKKVGYELRCHDPVAFDIQYTRDLGHSAVEYLYKGGNGGLVLGDEVMSFEDLRDPETGKTKVRLVDINSMTFKVARQYMTRFEKSDFETNSAELQYVADLLKISVEDFHSAYKETVELHHVAYI